MLRFALKAIRGEFLSEKEGESKKKRKREIHTIWRGKHQWINQQGKGWVNAKIG